MAVWRGLGNGTIRFGAPGESIARVNKHVSPEQRAARVARQRIEAIEEWRREQRKREGDW